MKPTNLPLPTAKELQLLNILWQKGPTTVRDIHEQIKLQQKTAYTTTLKMMQVMHQKGLVIKDTKPIAHIYTTTLSREQTQTQLLNNLADHAFSGSITELIRLAKKSNNPNKSDP